jgi:hypothetical protein
MLLCGPGRSSDALHSEANVQVESSIFAAVMAAKKSQKNQKKIVQNARKPEL